jgi:hypothetical protein
MVQAVQQLIIFLPQSPEYWIIGSVPLQLAPSSFLKGKYCISACLNLFFQVKKP